MNFDSSIFDSKVIVSLENTIKNIENAKNNISSISVPSIPSAGYIKSISSLLETSKNDMQNIKESLESNKDKLIMYSNDEISNINNCEVYELLNKDYFIRK